MWVNTRFLLRDEKAVPIEVKSGKGYHRHKALDNVMAVDEWGIDEALAFCPANVETVGHVTYLPWYMLMFCTPAERESLKVTWDAA